MSYATPTELIESTQDYLVAQLTGTDEPDIPALQRALDDASAEIDGYIASRYALPLPTVPNALRRICIDIAIYRLMNLRGMGDVEDSRQRYMDAKYYLKDVIKGEATLGLPETDASAGSASGIAFTQGSSVMKGLDY